MVTPWSTRAPLCVRGATQPTRCRIWTTLTLWMSCHIWTPRKARKKLTPIRAPCHSAYGHSKHGHSECRHSECRHSECRHSKYSHREHGALRGSRWRTHALTCADTHAHACTHACMHARARALPCLRGQRVAHGRVAQGIPGAALAPQLAAHDDGLLLEVALQPELLRGDDEQGERDHHVEGVPPARAAPPVAAREERRPCFRTRGTRRVVEEDQVHEQHDADEDHGDEPLRPELRRRGAAEAEEDDQEDHGRMAERHGDPVSARARPSAAGGRAGAETARAAGATSCHTRARQVDQVDARGTIATTSLPRGESRGGRAKTGLPSAADRVQFCCCRQLPRAHPRFQHLSPCEHRERTAETPRDAAAAGARRRF